MDVTCKALHMIAYKGYHTESSYENQTTCLGVGVSVWLWGVDKFPKFTPLLLLI